MVKFGKTARLLAMLGVTTMFFLVEIIVGYLCHSMALVADSFHMLSDVMALLVAFLSVRISKRKSSKNTFGWARAEVLGALVNSVFLIALCFSIFVEAIQRLHEPHDIEHPLMVLGVGCVGLVVNLIGLLLFHQHSHGHDHSTEKERTINSSTSPQQDEAEKHKEPLLSSPQQSVLLDSNIVSPAVLNGDAAANDSFNVVLSVPEPRIASSSQLNMKGVFLHVLGDALGSCVVIVSALVIYFVEWEHKKFIDPAMSIVMVMIISYTTLPLLRESAMILMQTVPTHIEIEDIKANLLRIPGVLAVHELHVWQLAGDRIIASAHIRCHNLKEYMVVAIKVKQFFHDVGIHSTTMQPEFEENPFVGLNGSSIPKEKLSSCILQCPSDEKNKKCITSVCCLPSPRGPLSVTAVTKTEVPPEQQALNLEQVLAVNANTNNESECPLEDR